MMTNGGIGLELNCTDICWGVIEFRVGELLDLFNLIKYMKSINP
jgi:hypothetical protein